MRRQEESLFRFNYVSYSVLSSTTRIKTIEIIAQNVKMENK